MGVQKTIEIEVDGQNILIVTQNKNTREIVAITFQFNEYDIKYHEPFVKQILQFSPFLTKIHFKSHTIDLSCNVCNIIGVTTSEIARDIRIYSNVAYDDDSLERWHTVGKITVTFDAMNEIIISDKKVSFDLEPNDVFDGNVAYNDYSIMITLPVAHQATSRLLFMCVYAQNEQTVHCSKIGNRFGVVQKFIVSSIGLQLLVGGGLLIKPEIVTPPLHITV